MNSTESRSATTTPCWRSGKWACAICSIPLQDLRNAEARRRIRGLLPLGQTFTLYSYGLPTPRDAKLIQDNAALLSGWEISFRERELGAACRRATRIATRTEAAHPAQPDVGA